MTANLYEGKADKIPKPAKLALNSTMPAALLKRRAGFGSGLIVRPAFISFSLDGITENWHLIENNKWKLKCIH
jgi:hypothetical protein